MELVLLELRPKQGIFSMVQRSLLGRGLLIIEASRSHKDTTHSVGLLWTTDRPDAETSTWNRSRMTRYTRGAGKSLARPTSRCRRTESIVPLERGVYSCAELQVFSCYRGWKETCRATQAISTRSRRKLSSSFFFPTGQGAEGNSHNSERNIRGTCTIVCQRKKLGGPF